MSRSEFTPEELNYYSRQLVLSDLGLKGQSKFKKARVLVAGVGGLGSQISAQLASMGIGFIRIIWKIDGRKNSFMGQTSILIWERPQK